MNPKEKALLIYGDYYLSILQYGKDLSQEITISILAQKCSIIAVDRILFELPEDYQEDIWAYWKEVKQEIKKL